MRKYYRSKLFVLSNKELSTFQRHHSNGSTIVHQLYLVQLVVDHVWSNMRQWDENTTRWRQVNLIDFFFYLSNESIDPFVIGLACIHTTHSLIHGILVNGDHQICSLMDIFIDNTMYVQQWMKANEQITHTRKFIEGDHIRCHVLARHANASEVGVHSVYVSCHVMWSNK